MYRIEVSQKHLYSFENTVNVQNTSPFANLISTPVFPFWPKYRLHHLENYSFLSSKKKNHDQRKKKSLKTFVFSDASSTQKIIHFGDTKKHVKDQKIPLRYVPILNVPILSDAINSGELILQYCLRSLYRAAVFISHPMYR